MCTMTALLPRCPTGYCQVARPFEDTPVATTTPTAVTQSPSTPSTPTTPTTPTIPPLPEQVCTETGIKEAFYSDLGQKYCLKTCLGKPMATCNLYICFCNTAYFTEKEIYYDDLGDQVLIDDDFTLEDWAAEEELDKAEGREEGEEEGEAKGIEDGEDDSMWRRIVDKKMFFWSLFADGVEGDKGDDNSGEELREILE